jgi:hypothetical protein
MLVRYTRMAPTMSALTYEPFPDVTEALPELAEEARLATRLAEAAAPRVQESSNDSSQPDEIVGCEGGDLNPYANYGASTSS